MLRLYVTKQGGESPRLIYWSHGEDRFGAWNKEQILPAWLHWLEWLWWMDSVENDE